jgi:hypothetical protein
LDERERLFPATSRDGLAVGAAARLIYKTIRMRLAPRITKQDHAISLDN